MDIVLLVTTYGRTLPTSLRVHAMPELPLKPLHEPLFRNYHKCIRLTL
jgi:hypothetical protein